MDDLIDLLDQSNNEPLSDPEYDKMGKLIKYFRDLEIKIGKLKEITKTATRLNCDVQTFGLREILFDLSPQKSLEIAQILKAGGQVEFE